jgi:hypothetical protein
MTPSDVPPNFERAMGCTTAELIGWLPIALPDARLAVDSAASSARADFVDGTLHLRWHPLPQRRIALLAIPNLHVAFSYEGLNAARRHAMQRRFDLATQRGGG